MADSEEDQADTLIPGPRAGTSAYILGRLSPKIPLLRSRRIWVEGPFSDWASAEKTATGYDDSTHVERVALATRAVIDGRAAYERDGVAFESWEPDLPVLLAVLSAVSRLGRPIRVLDVGGSMGGTFLRASVIARPSIGSWHVVEQEGMVACARAVTLDPCLTFGASLESGLALGPDLIIFGSVLQYLVDPDEAVAMAVASTAAVVALTRTPIVTAPQHLASVEHVPPIIGEMHYPMWLLSATCISEDFHDWVCHLDQESLGGCMVTSKGRAFQWRDLVFARDSHTRSASG
jgi:putative methyltransferase (TIGR04325 family)